jgi:hypothetical protein
MAKTVEELQAQVDSSNEYIVELSRVLKPLADDYGVTGGVVDQAKALMTMLRTKTAADPKVDEMAADLVRANGKIAKLEEHKVLAIARVKELLGKITELGGEL